ncbi:MAG: hydroxymethylglutaryl-CoA reductase, degradative [Anaerolineae bacterium]|nr:hydroxymethylglutaryl-CoA reductase, degradative [Anaerolineae bacterium]
MDYSSRLEGFYKLSPGQRIEWLAQIINLGHVEVDDLLSGGLGLEEADRLSENVVGLFDLPFGIAANFTINDRDYLIPMVTEEPSVIAACSHAAKIVRASGGFHARAADPVMVGQIQLIFEPVQELPGESNKLAETVARLKASHNQILAAKTELLELANQAQPNLVRRGGGARDLWVREFFETRIGPMLVLYLAFDTRDAMGANMVNTALERIGPHVAELTGARVHLRILTNLSDRRLASATCRITTEAIGGADVARLIVEAQVLAEVDHYRAATHNKGIMNGIDAVALATGNDFRAIESGAHAFAARDGGYHPLSMWEQASNGDLIGSLELPLAVGIVGGMTKLHRVAQIALRILDVKSSQELAAVMAAVGLAQNLAALRALATDGIQKGHMKLHARRRELENQE